MTICKGQVLLLKNVLCSCATTNVKYNVGNPKCSLTGRETSEVSRAGVAEAAITFPLF